MGVLGVTLLVVVQTDFAFVLASRSAWNVLASSCGPWTPTHSPRFNTVLTSVYLPELLGKTGSLSVFLYL